MYNHRWSGWPGAWCLDCGDMDKREECLGGVCGVKHVWPADITGRPPELCPQADCMEPRSHGADPYLT